MLIITLGTQASASTWVFNAVRAIFSANALDAMSGMSEVGSEFLGVMKPDVDHFILKAHRLDQNILHLARLSAAKIIVTTRDPRDVLASQKERFDADYREQIGSLSCSLTSIASLPPELEIMYLRYEDRFFERADTIRQLAHFLSLPITDEQCASIASAHSAESVKARISAWVDTEGCSNPDWWDTASHWHPGHVGDGRSGKFSEIIPDVVRKAAESALGPFDANNDYRFQPVFWHPYLFNGVNAEDNDEGLVTLTGEASLLVHGPYLSLPVGRWMMRPIFNGPAPDRSVGVKIDAYTYADYHGVMEMKTVVLPSSRKNPFLEVDVVNHLHPIEFRVFALGDGRKGAFHFGGVHLTYLGDSFVRELHTSMSRVI
ncbi:sulfotransferase domain-containing protein [Brevundimonas aurantiaca]|uniref:sulfotransferase domain-containing protein n=1 Tax=Brevundimonas aurantiaca TaxID=74316 RepID=UPI002FDD3426